jgi:F0F1-type ATP synthase assembly protein I
MEKEKSKNRNAKWQSGIALFSRISGWIIGPVIGAMLLIRWLNGKYEMGLGMILLIIGIVFTFSFLAIFREAKKEMKKNN